jgi:hypothetical protein
MATRKPTREELAELAEALNGPELDEFIDTLEADADRAEEGTEG